MLRRTSWKLPAYTADSEAFWKGGAEGALLIHRCSDCSTYHHPPAPVCHKCNSRNVAPLAVSGRGTVVSFTVNYQSWLPGLEVPFVVAYVAIEEQQDVWLMSNIVNCHVDEVEIGMPLAVVFEQQDEIWVPLFEPYRNADV